VLNLAGVNIGQPIDSMRTLLSQCLAACWNNQLKKEGDKEASMTIVVSPLTGRAKIEKGAVDYPEPRGFDDEINERPE